jgi:serine/threonine-protein kinase RsbW
MGSHRDHVTTASDLVETVPGTGTRGGRIVRLTIPARAEYIALCRLALTGLARVGPISDEVLADLKLALTEAASNSIRHAYPDRGGRVEIAYELYPDRLAIEVSDDGEGFDPVEEAELGKLDGLTEGGLGIAIIRAIADEFLLGRGPDGRGSRLRFVKVLAA